MKAEDEEKKDEEMNAEENVAGPSRWKKRQNTKKGAKECQESSN